MKIYFCMCSETFGHLMSINGIMLNKSLRVLSIVVSMKHLNLCLILNFVYEIVNFKLGNYVRCE